MRHDRDGTATMTWTHGGGRRIRSAEFDLLDKNCSPWLIHFTDALICFDACPRVCVRVVNIFFMCNFTEEPITSSDSECVTVFVTTFVNMDIGKARINASKNFPNKWLAHS